MIIGTNPINTSGKSNPCRARELHLFDSSLSSGGSSTRFMQRRRRHCVPTDLRCAAALTNVQ
eukprot:2314386-Pleurochrysis_carterae.AAC.1